jgi:hypothetical protein
VHEQKLGHFDEKLVNTCATLGRRLDEVKNLVIILECLSLLTHDLSGGLKVALGPTDEDKNLLTALCVHLVQPVL